MGHDELDIFGYNQDDDLLKRMNLLTDEEDDGDDIHQDTIDFLLT